MILCLLCDREIVLESVLGKYSEIDGKIDAMRDKNSKIEQKWTLGGLKINRRVAVFCCFYHLQRLFSIDFTVLPWKTFRNHL